MSYRSTLRFISPVLLALGTVGLAIGCGGEEEDGTGLDNGMAADSNIMLDGMTPGPTNGENAKAFAESDGGLVDLSASEIAELEDLACTGWSAEGENLPAILELVVDVSRSMTEQAPGSNQSKWEITRDALGSALDSLPASVAVGVLFYPNMQVERTDMSMPLDSCVNTNEMVDIELLGSAGSDHRTTLARALDQARTDGYTPTHDAYKYALQNGLIPNGGVASKFMLLITDGAPTMREVCNGGPVDGGSSGGDNQVYDQPTQPIIDEIAGALSGEGIRTFLIGSPGSEESSEEMEGGDMRPWLSRAAIAGDTAKDGCNADGPNFCHLDMTQEPDFSAALTAGLADIAGQIVNSCTFAVPSPEPGESIDKTLTNLVITWSDGSASLVRPDNVGDCSQGWRYDADGNVELCDDLCNRIKVDNAAQVQLTFGCSLEEIEEVPK